MQKFIWSLLILITISIHTTGQTGSYTWHNPMNQPFPVVEGQGWPAELFQTFHRLPNRFEEQVREPVWNLSKHASGLYIKFQSNATDLQVQYQVSGQRSLNHIPETGVSGLDLYALHNDGEWMWVRPQRNFGDTIRYSFRGIRPTDSYHTNGRTYWLYLPYFNEVDWLKIGVEQGAEFRMLPLRFEKPIVTYGTSIMHGACATRPGLTWTNILGRKMDRPIINLGFSGNGRLEPEIIDAMTELDAKLYILDCLPNLWREENYDDNELRSRISNSIKRLKQQRPEVPILLVDHAGYTDGAIQPMRQHFFERVNNIQQETFETLVQENITGIYYLPQDQINIGIEGMVDGTHPNDVGMLQYAETYEEKIRQILMEPQGTISTTQPISQWRDGAVYNAFDRHQQILGSNTKKPPKHVIIGNSITHFWGGLPEAPIARESVTWDSILTPLGVKNFGFGWDRIENVLWRIYHDELDGFDLDHILLLLGTNNLHLNTDVEIIEGMRLLIQAIQHRQPQAQITLGGILPRRNYEERILSLNQQYARLAADLNIGYHDFGAVLLDGKAIDEHLFSDGLHPNKEGYQKLQTGVFKIFRDKE